MSLNISVIIPAYSRFSHLRHAVESVLAQTVPVSEVIIVDDGSMDETPTMVPRLIAEDPRWRERVSYFYQENQGQCVAINNGIARAKGDWLGFIAHDDLWLPWKLEWQFRALEKFKDQAGLCFTDAWFMNNPHMKMNLFQFAGKQLPGSFGIIKDPDRLIVNPHPVWVQTCIARSDLVRQINGFDPKLRYSEDHDFLFRMALQTKFCYVGMPMTLIDRSPADIRHVGEGRNWHKEEFCLQADQYRFEKQLSLSEGLQPDVRKSILRNLRSVHSAWANLYLAKGDHTNAREAISKAAEYELTPNLAFKWILSRFSPKLAKKVLSIRDKNPPTRHDRVSWQDKEES